MAAQQNNIRYHVPCKIIVLGDGGVGKTCMLYSYTNQYQFLADKQGYVRTVFETYHAVVDVDGAFPPSRISQHPTAMQLALWDTAGQEQYNELRSMCYMKTDMSAAAAVTAASPASPSSPPSSTGPSSSPSASTVRIVQLTPRFASSVFDVSVFVLCFSWNDSSSLTHVENKWYKEVVRFAKDVEAEREASETSSDGQRRAAAAAKKKFTAPPSSGGSTASGRPFVVILCGTKSDMMSTAAPGAKGMVTFEQVDYVASKISADAVVSCSAKTGEGVKEVLDTAMKKWFQRVMDDLPDVSPSHTMFSSFCTLM
jgi:GTPase SAR1 family protein